MSAGLGDVHLENIGKDGGGASPGQVAGIIAASLVKWVGVALKTVDLGDIMKVIGDNTEGLPITSVGTVSHPTLAATTLATSMRRWRVTSGARRYCS